MRITPHDIRQQQFTLRRWKGYDIQEVDAFLEDVGEDYELLLKEAALLREQLAAQEERARGVTEREKSLQDTLVTTQRLIDEMKASAKRDADLFMREAELRADRLAEDARTEEAKIRAEINALKRMRRQVVEDLTSTMDRYQRLMKAELEPRAPSEDSEA
jgi:cell division initiation protein